MASKIAWMVWLAFEIILLTAGPPALAKIYCYEDHEGVMKILHDLWFYFLFFKIDS